MNEALISIIAAGGAVAAAVATGLLGRARVRSGAIVDYVGTYETLIDRLKSELAEERKRASELEARLVDVEQICESTRQRMLRLEAFIRLNTAFDPEHINGQGRR